MKKRLLSIAITGILFATSFSGFSVFAEGIGDYSAYDEVYSNVYSDHALAQNDVQAASGPDDSDLQGGGIGAENKDQEIDTTARPTEDIDENSSGTIQPEDSQTQPEETQTQTEDSKIDDLGTEIENNAGLTFDSYEVNFQSVLDAWPRKGYAVFNIYTADNVLLDSITKNIEDIEDFSIEFTFPEKSVGTVLYLEVTGVDSIDYYSDNYKIPSDEKLPLYTYTAKDEATSEDIVVNSAYMTIHMRTQPKINIYVGEQLISLSSAAVFEGSSIIAPLSEIAEAIGISDCTYFPEYNSVRVETGDHIMYVNIGFSYVTIYGNDIALNVPVTNINSLTYIELRPFVEAFGSTLSYTDKGDYCDIVLTKSPKALEAIAIQEQSINNSGVGSKTNYLIWVNKQKFRCTVFEGSKGNWTWVKDFTVGIGANGTETITGTFEYIDKTNMWPYASYYVGPVMIFYGNYALHSTFLKYDGTPYNNTVGAKISLGCVRCQAKYINWMVDHLPMYTRVYVTEH